MDIAYVLGLVGFIPVMLYQRIKRGKRRTGWRERFGHVPHREGSRGCIWIHGVSAGEVNATYPLVAAMKKAFRNHDIVISATTDTGLARAKQLYKDHLVFRYPLDFSWAVSRVMKHIRPHVIVLMELEVWPNLLAQAHRAGAPVIIANGRVETGSVEWFTKPVIRAIARRMFRRVSVVCAQDEMYAQRFCAVGVPDDKIHVTGSLKWDAAIVADRVEGDQSLAKALMIDRSLPLWVAGNTGAGEEAMILEAYKTLLESHPQLQLAIVPRHPERFGSVCHLIEDGGFACLRRSQHLEKPPQALQSRTVVLGDTMGELRRFYALATVVFVGRSLVPMGGSDIMEVAGLAKPMLFGPHMEHFADAAHKLVSARGAVKLNGQKELVHQVDRLLTSKIEAKRMGQQARQVVLMSQGAAEKTVSRVQEALAAKART